ncbi:MAG TPA: LptF/LptG family permease [Desulfomonilaceae bacterium]|nr:LptF/LptG family permease [Desulfomonilaceae bacterium]
MVFPGIIDRYVFREISGSFLFCFAVFLITGLIAGFLPLLQKSIEVGLTVTLLQVLVSAFPGTLVTVLPLSIMIGILLGLGRMAADNEIAALKSSGVSVTRLLPPVLLLGLTGFGLSLFCTFILVPRGISEGRKLMHEAASRRIDAGIEEKTFFDSLKNLLIYVEKIDSSTGIMDRVFIRESSQPDEINTIMAQKGKSAPDPEGKSLILNLRNGTIIKENSNGDSTGSLAFESYVFRFPVDRVGIEKPTQSFEELSIPEIRKKVQDALEQPEPSPDIREFHRKVATFARMLITQRFTHPLACLALALFAFPLGVLNLGRSRLNNVSVGLAVIFLYYAFTLATERIARSGLAPPELMLPLPCATFLVASAYFVRQVRLEKIPGTMRLVQRVLLRIRMRAK